MSRRLVTRFGAALGIAVLTATAVAVPAEAAHYQGGNYARCLFPADTRYDGVYVQGYGLGSDTPRNASIQGWGLVQAAKQCLRKGAVYHVKTVQIDKIAMRKANVNYKTRGPFNNGTNRVSAVTLPASPACGQQFQTALRFSVRYSNGALSTGGFLNSGGYKRC